MKPALPTVEGDQEVLLNISASLELDLLIWVRKEEKERGGERETH
jgi:hypothetical protein